MLKVGLTGGIGSGKSVVATIFRQLGVPVYDADSEARMLTESSAEIKSEIQKSFGEEFFNPDKSLNRAALAKIVFDDKEKLKALNAIIHPAVKEHFENWLQQNHKAKYIIKEAAILFKAEAMRGWIKLFLLLHPKK